MIAFLPTTAAPGRPPATILASVVMSGVTPKYAWAPAGRVAEPGDDLVEDEHDVVARAGVAQFLEIAGIVGVVPDWPPAGSRMTAATSPRSRSVSAALMSFGGHSSS